MFTFRGKPIRSVKTAFGTACKRAGIEDFRFHDLRHTFASRLVQGGVPLYNVMSLTGHKSLSMVQRYAHLAPDFQEEAIKVLDSQRQPERHNMGTVAPAPVEDISSKSLKGMVPLARLELATPALRMRCSTN